MCCSVFGAKAQDGDLLKTVVDSPTVQLDQNTMQYLDAIYNQVLSSNPRFKMYSTKHDYILLKLDPEMVIKEILITAQSGVRGISEEKVKYYNLDAILSLGYRVNSVQATAFRRWATSVLKQYMLKGYAVNQISAPVHENSCFYGREPGAHRRSSDEDILAEEILDNYWNRASVSMSRFNEALIFDIFNASIKL